MEDQTNDAQNASGQGSEQTPPPPPPPPAAAAPPPAAAPAPRSKVTLDGSTGSLVCGIIGVCTSCFFIGWILGIIAIVLNRKAIAHERTLDDSVEVNGKGNATAGLVLGIIATVLGLFYLAYYFIFVAAIVGGIGAMQELQEFQ